MPITLAFPPPFRLGTLAKRTPHLPPYAYDRPVNGAERISPSASSNLALNGAAQGPCAILRIKSRWPAGHRLGRDLQFNAAFRQPLRPPPHTASAIRLMSSSVSSWNTMISSTRLRNSGREYSLDFLHDVIAHLLIGFFAAIRAKGPCALLFDRSTHRRWKSSRSRYSRNPLRGPAPSVNLPSSRICKSIVEYIRCAFFHFIQEHDGTRLSAHSSVSWPPSPHPT